MTATFVIPANAEIHETVPVIPANAGIHHLVIRGCPIESGMTI
jgi:hypothetical protein